MPFGAHLTRVKTSFKNNRGRGDEQLKLRLTLAASPLLHLAAGGEGR
jgi:hypothetical protein